MNPGRLKGFVISSYEEGLIIIFPVVKMEWDCPARHVRLGTHLLSPSQAILA